MLPQAVQYLREAGQQASLRGAHQEAVAYYDQALHTLQQLPETRATCEQAIDLRLALRTALLPSGDTERILAELQQAASLATTLGDQRRRGRALLYLAHHAVLMNTHDRAITYGQHALAAALAEGDVVSQALAHHNLGTAYMAQGDYQQALHCFGHTVACLDDGPCLERFGQVIPPAVSARANLAACHAELGTFAAGAVIGNAGLQMAEAIGHTASLMHASWGLGLLFLRQGNLSRALPLLEHAVALCHRAALQVWFPMIAPALGTAYTMAQRCSEAVALLTGAFEQGNVHFGTLCSLALGEAHLHSGCPKEAQRRAVYALTRARAHQEQGHQAHALCLLGAVTARHDSPDNALAATYYQQALTLAEACGIRPLQAHCHLGLGTLYATSGQREPARVALTTAVHLYRALEMTFWLPSAATVLAQIG